MTIPAQERSVGRRWVGAAFLLTLAVALVRLALLPAWLPVADEVDYLTYGRTLAECGTYAHSCAGPAADAGPGREPLYPLAIAMAMRTDPLLGRQAGRCIGSRESDCAGAFRSLAWLNALLLAATAAFAAATVRSLGGSRWAVAAAGLYVALNFQVMKDLNHVISDYLAMALAALLGWALARALRRPGSGRWALAGGALGLLILVKSSFAVLGVALAGLAVAAVATRRLRPAPLLAALLVVATLAGGWGARNAVWFGRGGDLRGAIALSTREVFDHMSGREYAASLLWWTRGFGNGLTKRLFAPEDWRRLELYEPDGLYLLGQEVNVEVRLGRLMAAGMDRPTAEARLPRVILREMIAEAPMYLATMVPLFWRGLWFDEFIVLGLPALVWLVAGAWRRRDWPRLAAVLPALFCLAFYTAISLNVPRYQMPDLAGMAVAFGLAVAACRKARQPML